nr:capsid protein [Botryosphaeria dothidea partitivirus 3]
MSSVTPAESVSQSGNRTSKPGKRERKAKRSAVGSAGGQPAAASKAAVFASGSYDPVPQPGKFPVVFQTGAGEPTRDVEFALDLNRVGESVNSFGHRFKHNPKYAEFTANAEIENEEFLKQLSAATLLRMAQQVVHAHVNMGLPQGDFAPIASSDVRVPQSIASFVSQIGEFAEPSIGTRFLFEDYDNTVKKLVFMADKCWHSGDPAAVLRRSWLPMGSNDGHTRVVIAGALQSFIERGINVKMASRTLEDGVFSGSVPEAWETVKTALGDPPSAGQTDVRDRFDFLFRTYRDAGQFATAFTAVEAVRALGEIGLTWNNPSAGQLDWSYNAKQRFSSLADAWAKRSAAYGQFFELSTGLATRQAARGSQAQLATVSSVEGITVIKSHLAMAAPQFSLVACFPVPGVFVGGITQRVVLTTSLNVGQRATEFCQQDWR